ncbi:MAG: FliM/FliN family flagellar motor switch protein [Polyangiales bacterium]|nr:FliM/FliN family flagellar motor switch protein [Myxococcales bacterium]
MGGSPDTLDGARDTAAGEAETVTALPGLVGLDVGPLQTALARRLGDSVRIQLGPAHLDAQTEAPEIDETEDPRIAALLETSRPGGQPLRWAVEFDWALAVRAIDAALGRDRSPLRDALERPLLDGERGVLHFVAAELVAAFSTSTAITSTTTVHQLVTTPDSIAAWIGPGRRIAAEHTVTVGTTPACCRSIFAAAIAHEGAVRAPILEAGLDVAESFFPAEVLAKVAAGDALTFDAWWASVDADGCRGQGVLRATGGGTHAWFGTFGDAGFTLERATEDAGARGMEDVRVSVEVASVRFAPGGFDALAPGDVLRTPKPVGGRITLRTAQGPWAAGELVRVGDELAVRVVRRFADG